MKCPFCGGKSAIRDSRQRKKYYIRRHECLNCHRRFSTHETYAKEYEIKPVAFIKGVKRGSL